MPMSIIEWHPASEPPTDDRAVLLGTSDGTAIGWYDEGWHSGNVSHLQTFVGIRWWANFPKTPQEVGHEPTKA